MMNEELDDCSSVIDCHGLHAIATASDNLKAWYIGQLASGAIGVPTCVWEEFEDLFEQEAQNLAAHVARKIKMKKAYHTGAATVADRANARFSLSPYDNQTDFYAVSICSVESLTLITSASHSKTYDGVDLCDISDLESWAQSH